MNPSTQRNDITPTRYKGDGTGDATNYYNNNCLNDIDYTNGEILFSFSQMINQVSCNPFTGNGGNWYSWPAATAGGSSSTRGYNEPNSICPSGWQLTVNAETKVKSWYYLIRNTYGILSGGDENIRLLPMSFVRSGAYVQESFFNRADYGYYWSSTADSSNNACHLNFNYRNLNHQSNNYKSYGLSVRCVSR